MSPHSRWRFPHCLSVGQSEARLPAEWPMREQWERLAPNPPCPHSWLLTWVSIIPFPAPPLSIPATHFVPSILIFSSDKCNVFCKLLIGSGGYSKLRLFDQTNKVFHAGKPILNCISSASAPLDKTGFKICKTRTLRRSAPLVLVPVPPNFSHNPSWFLANQHEFVCD